MENTEKVLFEDNSPRWYVAIGDGWIGPMSASDVYEKVMDQELSWAHFVSKGGQTEWKRICDTKEFQVVVPQQPGRALSKNLQTQIKQEQTQPSVKKGAAVVKAASDERGWFLYYSDTQFGPFTKDEIVRFFRIGRIHGKVHAWRNGMENWDRLEIIPAFKDVAAEMKAKPSAVETPALKKRSGKTSEVQRPKPEAMKLAVKGSRSAEPSVQTAAQASASAASRPHQAREQRKAPRAPLVAKIVLANGESVAVAVCRDISIGGMQVLTEDSPAAVGSKIKLNVSMTGGGGKSGLKILPFTATGVIVRILEDGHGFSFRFEKLSDAAKKAIEQYIKAIE